MSDFDEHDHYEPGLANAAHDEDGPDTVAPEVVQDDEYGEEGGGLDEAAFLAFAQDVRSDIDALGARLGRRVLHSENEVIARGVSSRSSAVIATT